MKPYLPLTLAMAIGLASGTLAQTGSQKLSPGQKPATPASQRSTGESPAQADSSASQHSAGSAIVASPNINSDPRSTSVDSGRAGESSAPFGLIRTRTGPPLQISGYERDYFEFGYSLSKAAFGYADIAKQSLAIQKSGNRMEQIKLLAALAPIAERDRISVREYLDRTVIKMRGLHAPDRALSIVRDAADRLDHPLALTGAAKDLAALSPDAGKTLASLNEFERISGLTESPEIAAWLKGRHKNRVGNVWYAEGIIAGIAEVASAQDMPELLPTVGEISTDLRGLRDWLQLRMPDPPSQEQTALCVALDDFLRSTSVLRRQDRPVTHTELLALGNISQQLQEQVLPQTASAAKPTLTPESAARRVAEDKKSL